MDRYEVIVVIAVENGVRDIASPRAYEQLAQAEAELARLTAALQSGDWREVPWLSVFKGGEPQLVYVRRRRLGLPALRRP